MSGQVTRCLTIKGRKYRACEEEETKMTICSVLLGSVFKKSLPKEVISKALSGIGLQGEIIIKHVTSGPSGRVVEFRVTNDLAMKIRQHPGPIQVGFGTLEFHPLCL